LAYQGGSGLSSSVHDVVVLIRSPYNPGMRKALHIALAPVIAFAILAATPAILIAETGLPLPRFASLRANKVHLRTGPGIRYPVDWIFVHRGLPMEIVAEFENWRKVRDWQGTEGWVHRSMLSGRRTAVITGGTQPMRRDPDPNASMTARVKERVVGRVLECEGSWCRIEIGKNRGWMRRTHVWGVYQDEKLN
jgi:SH3-like domain-containing protein